MPVGVLALQGSFNEHIAGSLPRPLFLFMSMYVSVSRNFPLLNRAIVFVCSFKADWGEGGGD